MQRDFVPDWKQRGLVQDITTEDAFRAYLQGGSRTFYVGFDPTAESLHVGNLLPLLALRRAQLAGHRPIALVGGATGLIGDPSGKKGERTLNSRETVAAWAEKIREQVARFLDFEAGDCSAIAVDNLDWIGKLDTIALLRDVGKHFPLGYMLGKESVKSRMDGDGISFTELAYMVLQAYDFQVLHETYTCTVQLGGSDQWGNITAGIDLVRRVHNVSVYGATVPLVTRSDGSKFGKSDAQVDPETGEAVEQTIWLDASRTSPYEMYQFWLNTTDADAGRFLRCFTFLSHDETANLERSITERPEAREAQRALAREVTCTVHGDEGLRQAERITSALFSNDIRSLDDHEFEVAMQGMPRTVLQRSDDPVSLLDLLVAARLAPAKGRARELVRGGSVRVNGEQVSDPFATFAPAQGMFGKYLLIRRGKKSYHVVAWE